MSSTTSVLSSFLCKLVKSALTVCLSLSVCLPAGAAVIFSDSEFLDSDWAVQVQADSTPGANGTFSAQQDTSIGNPGPSQRIAHTYTADGTRIQTFVTLHVPVLPVYDPSTEGAIASIDLSADVRGSYLWQFWLFQDGSTYIHESGTFVSRSAFATFLDPGLIPSDFVCIDEPGLCFDMLDFSTSGGPITFGISAGTSTNVAGTRNRLGYLDNWQATVNQVTSVPEPGTLAIFLTGLIGLIAFTRQSRPGIVWPE